MIDAIKVMDIKNQSLNPPKRPGKKPLKLLENNYRNNLDSDYTEKIKELDKNTKVSR